MGRRKKGAGVDSQYLFTTTNISTQPNIDPTYEEIGIIHDTETTGINLIRGAVTDFANIFGARGVDNPVFDTLRNNLLSKLQTKLNELNARNKSNNLLLKISNLRMDIDIQEAQLIMTAYGTLLSKKVPSK